MHKLIEFVLICVFATTGVSAPFSLTDDGAKQAQAQELLTQARNALGGDAKLKAVLSLSCSGKFRRILGPNAPEMDGDFEMEFLLPDKYKRTDNMSMLGGAAQVTMGTGFNGDQLLEEQSNSGGGGGVVMMRRGGGDDEKSKAARLLSVKSDATRTLLLFLLTAPELEQIQFSYAGEAESPDGKADVIEAKGANNFAARLFLDKKTHQPLMLSYRAVVPKMIVNTIQAHGHADAESRSKELEKQAQEEIAKAQKNESDIQVFLTDYRKVDGISLPHKLTRQVNGEVNEEMEVAKFKVNPPLKAERFKK
jgi:hypothetical protein